MLKGIINFFKGNDDELDAIEAKLDALEKAADERIAAKEARLKELTKNCDETRRNIEVLQENVARYEKAINQRRNWRSALRSSASLSHRRCHRRETSSPDMLDRDTCTQVAQIAHTPLRLAARNWLAYNKQPPGTNTRGLFFFAAHCKLLRVTHSC